MRRALLTAALAGGLVGYGVGAVAPVAADFVSEMVLYRTQIGVVRCLNFGDGDIGFERIDQETAILTCTGSDHDKDRDQIEDSTERRRDR
jgi:hypothetical protein